MKIDVNGFFFFRCAATVDAENERAGEMPF